MKTWFYKYWWVIALSALGLWLLYWLSKHYKSGVGFDFTINDNPSSFLQLLTGRYAEIKNNPNAKGAGIYLDIPITTTVSNSKSSAIDLKDTMGNISYNNEPIMQTKSDSTALKNINVKANDSTSVTDNVRVLVNPSSIKFFTELVKGNKPKVDYDIQSTLLGDVYNFKDSTVVNKSISQRQTKSIPVDCPDWSNKQAINVLLNNTSQLFFPITPVAGQETICPSCITYKGVQYSFTGTNGTPASGCYYKSTYSGTRVKSSLTAESQNTTGNNVNRVTCIKSNGDSVDIFGKCSINENPCAGIGRGVCIDHS